MCQGHRREVFDCEDYGKSQSTKVLSAISTECARPFSKIGSVGRRNYLNAIIAILIAHIINRIPPIAIAIFIVSSSSLVIVLPLFLDLNDRISLDARVFGYRRGVARPA
jgi:hypothetical protein